MQVAWDTAPACAVIGTDASVHVCRHVLKRPTPCDASCAAVAVAAVAVAAVAVAAVAAVVAVVVVVVAAVQGAVASA